MSDQPSEASAATRQGTDTAQITHTNAREAASSLFAASQHSAKPGQSSWFSRSFAVKLAALLAVSAAVFVAVEVWRGLLATQERTSALAVLFAQHVASDRSVREDMAPADSVRGLAGEVELLRKSLGSEYVRVAKRTIELGQTGHDVCNAEGKTCLAVLASRLHSRVDGLFWGYAIPSCNSRLSRKPGCSAGNDYFLDGAPNRRAKDALSKSHTEGGNGICLEGPRFDYTLCVDR